MHAQKGFSLVELIAVLVILGIVGAAGTLGFADAVRGFIFGEDNMALAQKAQMTLNRISIELAHLAYNPVPSHVDYNSSYPVGFQVTASSGSSITFNADYGQSRGTSSNLTINYGSNQITIGGHVLCDGVRAFSLSYLDENGAAATSFSPLNTRIVAISLTLADATGGTQVFTTRIMPKFPI